MDAISLRNTTPWTPHPSPTAIRRPLAPARDPPAWASDLDAGELVSPQGEPAGIDPLAQPEPEFIFDRRITW